LGTEPRRNAESQRGSRRSTSRPLPRRAAVGRRSFASTLKALDDLAASGAKISVRINDLDRGTSVLSGDDFVTLPVAGLGVVPLLIEVAAGFESGVLDPLEFIDRGEVDAVTLGGAEAPVIDGFTGVQRLLLSWAQIWQQKGRDAETIRLLTIDPHSPNEFRCNQIVRNIDAFYDAFGVTESDELWLDADQRVTIW